MNQLKLLKSHLLISTDLDSLPDNVVQVLKNEEVIAVHQDPLGVQAVRVSSVLPADAPHDTSSWDPGTSSLLLLRPCDPSNPLQQWRLGNGSTSTAGRLWTADAKGKRWCVGESNWARPGEVLPCDDPRFQKGSVPGCGCSHDGSPCCHEIDDYRSEPFVPQCVEPFAEPKYCSSKSEIGGVVGEGHGCGLSLSCGEGEGTIEEVVFADFGTVAYDREGGPGSSSSSSCDLYNFRVNRTCTSEARGLVEYVKSRCIGKASCTLSHKAVSDLVGDPCRKVHKRLAVVVRGCSGNNDTPALPLQRCRGTPSRAHRDPSLTRATSERAACRGTEATRTCGCGAKERREERKG